MRQVFLWVVSALALLPSCSDEPVPGGSARAPMEERLHLQRMLVLERPPIIAVQDRVEMPLAIRAAAGAESGELERRAAARWVGTDALPFLTETAAGLEFLAAEAPRALARGMPAEFCPALSAATGPPEAGRGQVARRALEGCLGQLGPEHDGCGCRVIALDDVVTVPRDETAYATGVSARMQVPALGIDLVLVAEEGRGEAPDRVTLLRDLAGPVARLVHGEDDRVAVVFADSGRRFEGRRIPVGFRRGRLAERIYASDAEGRRLSLLIGFEPDELAGQAAGWLAWPAQG